MRGRWRVLWMNNGRRALLLHFLWRSLLTLRRRNRMLLLWRRHLSLGRRSRTLGGRLLLWMLHGSRSLFLRRLRCLPLRSRLRMLLRHLLLWCGNSARLRCQRLRRRLRTHRLLHRRRMLLLLGRRLLLSLHRLGIRGGLTG